MIQKFFLLYLCISFSIILSGQKHDERYSELLSNFVDDPLFEEAQISLSIAEIGSGREILNFQGNKALPPASTLKLLYTLAAMDKLGADYTFQTEFFTQGEILWDGSLEGNLVIVASGDPSFASKRFGESKEFLKLFSGIYNRLLKSGIKCISGDLILVMPDQSYPVCSSWPFEDLGNYYASGAWGFNFNENEFNLILNSPGSVGKKCAILESYPKVKGMYLENHVLSGEKNSGDNAYIFGIPGDYYRMVKGTIPSGKGNFQIRGSMPHPPLDFLNLLKKYLENHGVQCEGISLKKELPKTLVPLAKNQSPDLLELSKLCNDFSINLYSEALGKKLLYLEKGPIDFHYPSEGDWEGLFSNYGINSKKVKIKDACGLSPFNLLSASSMTHFLSEISKRMEMDLMLDIIPKAGKDGNAISFMKGKKQQGRVWVKSGSIENVLNYAGVFKAEENDELFAFCVLTHHNKKNSEVRSKIERFLDAIITIAK